MWPPRATTQGCPYIKGGYMSDHKEGFEAPVTFVIALLFLAVFVVVYVVNFKLLSNIWQIR